MLRACKVVCGYTYSKKTSISILKLWIYLWMHIGKFPLRNFPSIYTAIARSYAAELGIPDSTCTYANVYIYNKIVHNIYKVSKL